MTIFNFLELLGGLSFFLFGMHILSDSLTTISGGKMEIILERLYSTKLRGLLLGIAITALIQSSSATTVMVVALVNSGVMKLKQVVPIIMGANIGTTVTGWILSLSGISGDSLLVQMLKPTSFTPILAMIGMILIITSKSDSKKIVGNALLGFAVLMFGMNIMSGSVTPLQSNPNFQSVFQSFSNPLLGILVGALGTAILQSSSAMTGILQALSTTGAITFGSVMPLIMGQNIGTCVTALLSSVGAGKNARRASIIHLIFNVIGTFLFMLLFYTINFFNPFPFMNNMVNEVNIAIVHTIFNLFTVIVLFPFSDQLVKLSRIIVPRKEPKIKQDDLSVALRLLDPRFLSRPGIAVEQAFTVLNKMMDTSLASLHGALELIFHFEPIEYNHVEMLENQVDRYEDELMDYTMKIAANSLNRADNQKLTIIMHTINDIERISDHAINIADEARDKFQAEDTFSEEALAELKLYADAVEDIMQITQQSLQNLDTTLALEIQPLEERIDEINKAVSDLHIDRLQQGICSIENGVTLVEIFTSFERIADHCFNISITLVQFSEQDFRQHDYEERFNRDSIEYKEMYQYFAEKYPLPRSLPKGIPDMLEKN